MSHNSLKKAHQMEPPAAGKHQGTAAPMEMLQHHAELWETAQVTGFSAAIWKTYDPSSEITSEKWMDCEVSTR